MPDKKSIRSNILHDGPASVVVFLVALPLCLGVSIASDAPAISGIIAGAVGGIVVGLISKSNLSVSGPAAGLTAIVASAIVTLNSFNVFLTAVVIAGVIQIMLGLLRAGQIADFIPNAVIKGMLAAIGIILILKQFPHLIGFDIEKPVSIDFIYPESKNVFNNLFQAVNFISPMSMVIGIISIAILFIGDSGNIKKLGFFKIVHPALIVVIAGIIINEFCSANFKLGGDKLINLPVLSSLTALYDATPKPDWSALFTGKAMWITAFTIAIVASLESLLSIEAVDKIDPEKNITSSSRELIAQGTGNIVSGLLGGLPVTSVIVRSSANVMAGARTKLSAIFHGVLLLLFVLFLPELLNKIPKASLAGILIFTGYKLAKFELFREYYQKGWNQFLPFIITILAIVFTDLLTGIIIGCSAGIFFVIHTNFNSAVTVIQDKDMHILRFNKDATFINKGHLKKILKKIPPYSTVRIDATRCNFIDQDIIDLVNDFIVNAGQKHIVVYIDKKIGEEKSVFNDLQQRTTT